MSHDDWTALLLDSEHERRSAVDPASETVVVQADISRGRGRPRGSTGSGLLRRSIAAHAAARAAEQASQEPAPGSIEYARSFRNRVQKQKASEQLTALPRSSMADGAILPASLGDQTSLLKIGTIAQRSMLAALFTNSCNSEERDVIVDGCLSEKALTSSAQAVANLSPGRATTAATVRRLLLQAGSAVQQMGSWMCGLLFSKLQTLCSADDRKEKGIAFVHSLRYDETPHSVRLSTTNHGQLFLRRTSGQAQDTGIQAWLADMGIEQSLKELTQTSTHAKIVQVEHKMGCLLRDSQGGHSWVETTVPCGLSAVDRTTGENMRSLLWNHIQLVPEIQRLWMPFDLQVRLSTADRAGSNNRAEIGLQEEGYMPHFIRASYDCDTHKVANAMKSALRLAEADMSGVLNMGLVSADPSATRTLRAVLIDIFSNDLEIRHRRAPTGVAARHRASVLDLFLPVRAVGPAMKRLNLKRRFILEHFLNDDWSLLRN